MKLETPRLVLSSYTEKDKVRLVELLNDKLVSATTSGIPSPYSMKDADFFYQKMKERKAAGDVQLAIRLKQSGELIGAIGLHTSLVHKRAMAGYWLTPSHWGKGLMTEALIRMIEYGFKEMDLIRIEAHHMAKNVASAKVMLKAGMEKEGYFRSHIIKDGEILDSVHYAIIK